MARCTNIFYGTTTTPIVLSTLLFFVVLILVVAAAVFRDGVPDSDDTNLVLVMSFPVAVGLFVVELLRLLSRQQLIDDLDGVVQEISDLAFYAANRREGGDNMEGQGNRGRG